MTGLIPDVTLNSPFTSFPENSVNRYFYNEHFIGVTFHNLRANYFRNCHFENCTFTSMTLDRCTFHHCTFTKCTFTDTIFRENLIRNTLFEFCTFLRVSFPGTSLTYSYIHTGVEFFHCTGIVSVSNVGLHNRTIYAFSSPSGPAVTIGCFTGTKEEAISRIREKYAEGIDRKFHASYQLAMLTAFSLLKAQEPDQQ